MSDHIISKHFKIAFSYAREYQSQVEKIADEVVKVIPQEDIFFDQWYTAQMGRPNLDIYLQNIYRNTELLVVFLSKEYAEKSWCSVVEWRIIREIIKEGNEDSRIMFIKCGEEDIELAGLSMSIDGYIPLEQYGEIEIANYIIDRHSTIKDILPKPIPLLYGANEQYIKSFTEPLFLHRDPANPNMTLENLFVLQDYKYLRYEEDSQDLIVDSVRNSDKKDLKEALADFLRDNEKRCLLISGDAGVGKTSLVAWMNYQYTCEGNIKEQLFGKEYRPLITIRMRDLHREGLDKEHGLILAICQELKSKDAYSLQENYPKAIIILDGFDELCIIEEEASVKPSLTLQELFTTDLKGFHFIITTRPKYISKKLIKQTVKKATFISLEHFNKEKRQEWIYNYTSEKRCNENIPPSIKEYIENIGDESASCICDTPMILYMLVSQLLSEEYIANSWSLYRYIFMEVLSEKEYGKRLPNRDIYPQHPIDNFKDILYQISEEIAYEMYKQKNQMFYLTEGKMDQIIAKLNVQYTTLNKASSRDIVKRCFGLCCYWKENANGGAVEFLHNNIRDFFLAEKIYREINSVIANHFKVKGYKYLNNELSENEKNYLYKEIGDCFCNVFQYDILEPQVTRFLYLRAKYYSEDERNDFQDEKYDFARFEYTHKLICGVMEYLNSNAIAPSSKTFLEQIQIMKNVLTCTAQIYRHLYEPHLLDGEKIHWGLQEKNNKNSLWLAFFQDIFIRVPAKFDSEIEKSLVSKSDLRSLDLRYASLRSSNLSFADLNSVDLSSADLNSVDLSFSDLSFSDLSSSGLSFSDLHSAKMHSVDLIGANLQSSNLSFAELQSSNLVSANLKDTNLKYANLNGANLSSSTFEYSDLSFANLNSANLSYANLSCSNLQGADLRDAKLVCVNLCDAKLENTILQDGFCSDNQIEQIEHLKSLGIRGLKI